MTVLWITGPRAVGKSAVGWAVFSRLVTTTKAGYIDFAQITFATPPLDAAAKARRVETVWRTHREEGARHLIVSGEYADVLPEAEVCLLRAGHDELVTRLLMRGRGEGPTLPGDELRGRSEEDLRRLAVPAPEPGADLVIDTDGRAVEEIADEIVRRVFNA
ncbi:hypothetical protein [Saccharothrix deserti]|uniref:hypothetical protein n=1 Tax=Saccharothrix deserti TaxID=2593674 RepID=UPI00131BF24C|nr:hypothetical protein [Saccharothrix deserti]